MISSLLVPQFAQIVGTLDIEVLDVHRDHIVRSLVASSLFSTHKEAISILQRRAQVSLGERKLATDRCK